MKQSLPSTTQVFLWLIWTPSNLFFLFLIPISLLVSATLVISSSLSATKLLTGLGYLSNLKNALHIGAIVGSHWVEVLSMLEGLAVYWLALAKIPSSILYTIRRLMFSFLWSGSAYHSSFHPCRWELIAKTKSAGGWGLCNLIIFQQALATKSLWRSITQGGVWQHIIFGKYIFPLSIARWLRQLIIYSTSASLIWRSLTNHLKFILHWIFWKPGSGLEILIGRDALSLDILEQLSFSNLHFLYQAKSPSRIPLLYSEPLLASSLSWLDHDGFVSIEC
jgi:hypothetical protein